MMKHEFEKLTKIYVTDDLYREIENAYYDFDGDKVAFCKAYKANKDGMAEAIMRRCFWKQFENKKSLEPARQPVKTLVKRVTIYDDIEIHEYELERTA